MKIIRAKDYHEMSRLAANLIKAQVLLKEDSVLGLATGSTVIGLYEELVIDFKKGELDFSKIRSVNLDEYVGLPETDGQSYRYFMNTNLFHHINILPENTSVPGGCAADPEEECRSYERKIAALGGVDIQLLGLGNNGHIGFNEPAPSFPKDTHLVQLEPSTIEANSRFFEKEEDVPKQAITMGIKTIMTAEKILLCVSGKGKAEILKKVLYGPITPEVPGSILQMHKNVFVVADEDALSAM